MKGERIELTVETREPGKSLARKLRRENQVPAIVYGTKKEAMSISLDQRLIVKYNTRAFENTLFTLKSKDSKLDKTVVLMKDVDVHPVTRRPDHVDFYAIDLTKTVRVSVEIKLEGKPIGLSEGGLLNQVVHKVEVECLPTSIPQSITADVSNLGLGDSLHISDLQMPEGVKAITAAEITVCVVNVLEEEVIAAPVAAAAPAEGAAAGAAATPAAGAAAPAADAKAAAAPAKDKK